MLLEQKETPGRQGASSTEGANPPPPILYITPLQVADKRDPALSRAHAGRVPPVYRTMPAFGHRSISIAGYRSINEKGERYHATRGRKSKGTYAQNENGPRWPGRGTSAYVHAVPYSYAARGLAMEPATMRCAKGLRWNARYMYRGQPRHISVSSHGHRVLRVSWKCVTEP